MARINRKAKLVKLILQKRRDGNILRQVPRRVLTYLLGFVENTLGDKLKDGRFKEGCRKEKGRRTK